MSIASAIALALAPAPAAAVPAVQARLPEDEVVYFLLPDRFENGDPSNDRGGIAGDRMAHGFDPTAKGFYHGGDLKGLRQRLPYIRSLGATAIWLAPIFKNKPVQGGKGEESAGYHGYWVTDFTTVDPHLGTEADFKALVDAAHAMGMKVYMDIITNHTADVIAYRECPTSACPYRSRADYPYQRGGRNPGFAGDKVRTAANFAKLTDQTFAYTPYVPAGEEGVKKPAWLNDIRYYHNRGNTTFRDESSTMGDFVGLDDLMTEHPRVVQGMIDIYGSWIDRFGIDGYRIDTARHVNPEFWAQFIPAIEARARKAGRPNFHIFGEVATGEFEPALTAAWTRTAKLPTNLDFAFRVAVGKAIAGNGPTDIFERLYHADVLYAGGEATARRLPTFTGNHDFGRFARDVRVANPKADDAEVLARVRLAHAVMMTLRGVPVIYSGDEQGFAGDGNDQDAREDMFASRTPVYLDNKLVGTDRTHATSNFATDHPLFRDLAALSAVRASLPALRRGRQVLRYTSDAPGLMAFSRFDPVTNREVLIAFNTSGTAISPNVEVEVASRRFATRAGACPVDASAPGQLRLSLPPFGYAICEARP